MKDERIAELRKLEAKISPKPWSTLINTGNTITIIHDGNYKVIGRNFLQADADLIITTRNALPELLDEIERLQEENRKLQFMLDNGLGEEDMVNDCL